MHTEQTEKEKHLFAGSDFWGFPSGLQISALYDVCVCPRLPTKELRRGCQSRTWLDLELWKLVEKRILSSKLIWKKAWMEHKYCGCQTQRAGWNSLRSVAPEISCNSSGAGLET